MSGENVAAPLPNNLEAERSVLGAILVNNEVILEASAALKPDDFFLDQHRRIFIQMLTLNATRQPIDLVTLADELHKKSELEAVGGAPYLSSLADGMPRVSNVGHYARIVKEASMRRRVIHFTEVVQQNAFTGDANAAAVVEDAASRIQQLKQVAHTATWQQAFHTVEELTDREVVHLIDRVLPEGVAFLGGLSGTGKTWFGLSMSHALIRAENFLGVFRVPTAQNVLYLVPEMGEAAFKKRCRRMGIGGPRFRCQTISDGAALDLGNPVLLAAVRELKPVIFLDTSIRFSNAESENSSAENRALSRAIFALLQTGAKAVVCLHHRGKGSAKADELTLENTLRGTTDLGAIADAVWGLKYDSLGGHSPYFKESQKLVRLDVRCVKSRDFAPPEDFRIQLFPYLDEIGDFGMLTSEPPEQQKSEIDRLVSAIEGNPFASKVQLQTATGIGRNRISKMAAAAGWSFKPLVGWHHD
jgi:hypothetical protein